MEETATTVALTLNEQVMHRLEECEDISLLPSPDEKTILKLLAARYAKNRIYSKCGDVLLALNPYCDVSEELYTVELLHMYRFSTIISTINDLPPHPWKTAIKAYRCMLNAHQSSGQTNEMHRNQSVVISGESGSGKTETTKIILNFLAKVGSFSCTVHKPSVEDFRNLDMSRGQIQSRILHTNRILEALGNARTIKNDNSSRFGKMIKLLFDRQGQLDGACVETFLLELTRVVQQQETERNFHIFYMILSEINPVKRDDYMLQDPQSYLYLLQNSSSGCFDRRDGVRDSELYHQFKSALRVLALSDETIDELLKALVAVLTIGNFACLTSTSSEGETVLQLMPDDIACLDKVSNLLSIPTKSLKTALTSRVVKAGGEIFVVTLNSDDIMTMRNVFAKSLYDVIFHWMIRYLNSTVESKESNSQKTHSIGLLDMFGFEDLSRNSLEQLLINYTNENLQQQFDFKMIESEQRLYISEGIEWSFIEFPSAKECLELVYTKRNGIISCLDEACRAPGGSDSSFYNSVLQKLANSPCLSVSKLDKGNLIFGIRHYAGLVKYDSTDFVHKNKVKSFPLSDLFSESKSKFILDLLWGLPESDQNVTNDLHGSRTIVVNTVADNFCENVNDLLSNINTTTSHYVKCFKPNSCQTKQSFVGNYVQEQLKYSGILHSLKVMRIGFPLRFSFLDFWEKYYPLIRSFFLKRYQHRVSSKILRIEFSGDEDGRRKAVDHLVERVKDMERRGELIVSPEFDAACSGCCIEQGKTTMFMRYSAFFTLESMLMKVMASASLKIQTRQRRNHYFAKYRRTRRAIVSYQRVYREYLVRVLMRRRRQCLCRFVQSVTRKIVGRRLARMLARSFRSFCARKEWSKIITALVRFIHVCKLKVMKEKFGSRCSLLCRALQRVKSRKESEAVEDAFFILAEVNASSNFAHYIRSKRKVEIAFRSVINSLQRRWRWKREVFSMIQSQQKVSFSSAKDSALHRYRQVDPLARRSVRTSRIPSGKELLRCNRLTLWSLFVNYINLVTESSPAYIANTDHYDRYNACCLPMKFFIVLMKDWEVCPQIVKQSTVVSIVNFLNCSKEYFSRFDEIVWGRRYPASSPCSPGKKKPPESPRKPVEAASMSGDVSFNLFCQVLLFLASALRKKGTLSFPDPPQSVLEVKSKHLHRVQFRDSSEVGLCLRHLLTAMDRSGGRLKLKSSRSRLAVSPFEGVLDDNAITKQYGYPSKKFLTGQPNAGRKSPPKRRKAVEIEYSPMSAEALHVLRKNRPQLLAIAVHYNSSNIAKLSNLKSDKDKMGFVYLSRDDVWTIANDFGVCPHHCSKNYLMDVCDMVLRENSLEVQETASELKSSPPKAGLTINTAPPDCQHSMARMKRDHMSYFEFVKVLYVLSQNLSNSLDVFEELGEKQLYSLLHIMNKSKGREKMASKRNSSIVQPFDVSPQDFAPIRHQRRSLSPFRKPQRREDRPRASLSALPTSPGTSRGRKSVPATPEPIGASKSMHPLVHVRGTPPRTEPPDFVF